MISDTAEPDPPAEPPTLVVPVSACESTVCESDPECQIVPTLVAVSAHSLFLSDVVPPALVNENLTVPPALKQ